MNCTKYAFILVGLKHMSNGRIIITKILYIAAVLKIYLVVLTEKNILLLFYVIYLHCVCIIRTVLFQFFSFFLFSSVKWILCIFYRVLKRVIHCHTHLFVHFYSCIDGITHFFPDVITISEVLCLWEAVTFMGQTMNSVTFLLLLHVYVAYNDIYLYNIPRSFLCVW